MSDAKDIAEKSGEICVAAVAFFTTAATTGFVAPLAVLATIGASRVLSARRGCTRRAADAALAAVQASPEFRGVDAARVTALMGDTARGVGFGPGSVIHAARAGGAAGYADALVAALLDGIAFEPGETAARRVVELAFGASVRCLLADPEMQGGMQLSLLLQAAQDQFAALGLLADLQRAQAIEAALAAARHAEAMAAQVEMMDHLRRTDEFRQLRDAGITEAAIAGLYDRAGVLAADPAEQWAQFQAFVEGAVRLQAEAAAGSNLGGWVDRVIDRAAALAREGRNRAAAEAVEAALAEEAAETRARQARLIDTALAHRLQVPDPEGAAALVIAREDLQAGGRASFVALRAAQDVWDVRGRDKGVALDQEVAIAISRLVAARADGPDQRGTALNDLGIALFNRGEREPGTARLDAAVAAYRAALEERTRDRVPLDWAMTQMNLGTALAALGQREPGTARLEAAVEAYRAALEERTRDRVPLDWAMTQMNLGTALSTLGEREPGTARLEAAVAAYRAALEERTRDRVPLDWARTQMNLGNALRVLGTREPGTARLAEAVAAYRAALEERTRDRVPLYWAATQVNLGTALLALGEREPGTERLEAAAVACRAALEEMTRDRVPLDWAMTQMNLGTALLSLGTREPGTARLEEAVEAFRAALEERTRDRVPLDWATTQHNLAGVFVALFVKTADPAHLDTAEAAARAAREVFADADAGHYLAHADARLADIAARRTP